MNKFQKMIAVAAATAVIGVGGFVSTTANAATNDQVADYLTTAVATQLGLADSTSLHTIVVEAMNNGLLQTAVTDAAAAAVDGTSTLTADEMAALLDANLTQQLGTITQQLVDLGVIPDPNAPVDPTTPTDPPVDPTDPGTGVVDTDDDADLDEDSDIDDDAEDAEDVDDDDLPGAVDHHGGRDSADDDSTHVNDPQGAGVGHTDHGNGRGVGHDHHSDDDND